MRPEHHARKGKATAPRKPVECQERETERERHTQKDRVRHWRAVSVAPKCGWKLLFIDFPLRNLQHDVQTSHRHRSVYEYDLLSVFLCT